MRQILIILALIFFTPFVSEGQKTYGKMKQKLSFAEGTIFGHWGYNRSAYTKSNIRFVGPGYDFTLEGAKAHDHPEKFSKTYWDPKRLTVPQFVWRIGYYFKDHWALSIGQDHMKYLFKDRNEVFLSGKIEEGVDQVTNWSGVYNAEPIITNRDEFHYENSDGLNYFRLELTRTDRMISFGADDILAINTNAGVSVGGILSFTDFRFGTKNELGEPIENRKTVSLSGYGISGHVSVRLELYRHFYIQPGFGAGMVHQIKAKTRPNDPSSYAREVFGYAEFNTVAGFLFYIRPKNGCDTCPTW